MTITNVNEVLFNRVNRSKMSNSNCKNSNEPILSFAEKNNSELQKDISDAKIKTEMFTKDILKDLDVSKSKKLQDIRYYLVKLINVVQILNGVKENNLKPNGDSEQNKAYEQRIEELTCLMNNYASYIESGLSISKDSKTGLYKLTIHDNSYDVPKRKVEILKENTMDGDELMPKIVD